MENNTEERDANPDTATTIPSEEKKNGLELLANVNEVEEKEETQEVKEENPVESAPLASPEKEQTKSKKPAPFEPTRCSPCSCSCEV